MPSSQQNYVPQSRSRCQGSHQVRFPLIWRQKWCLRSTLATAFFWTRGNFQISQKGSPHTWMLPRYMWPWPWRSALCRKVTVDKAYAGRIHPWATSITWASKSTRHPGVHPNCVLAPFRCNPILCSMNACSRISFTWPTAPLFCLCLMLVCLPSRQLAQLLHSFSGSWWKRERELAVIHLCMFLCNTYLLGWCLYYRISYRYRFL